MDPSETFGTLLSAVTVFPRGFRISLTFPGPPRLFLRFLTLPSRLKCTLSSSFKSSSFDLLITSNHAALDVHINPIYNLSVPALKSFCNQPSLVPIPLPPNCANSILYGCYGKYLCDPPATLFQSAYLPLLQP